jgi:hypothetical protein
MGEYEKSESGNWNFSSDYVQQIAKLFIEANDYKEIAKYGFKDILLDLNTSNSDKVSLRMRGLQKYIYKLKDIILYCKFAMKSQTRKDKLISYRNDLIDIEKNFLNSIIEEKQEGLKKKQAINEEMFDLIFNNLEKIDMDMREPINEEDLIFIHRDIIDPKEQKKKLKQGFIEGG